MKAMILCVGCMLSIVFFSGCTTAPGTETGREDLIERGDTTMKQMEAADMSLGRFVDNSAGYVIFPTVGKGGLGVGGAYGRGIVYDKGQMIGYADITQATIGLQAGGQSFSELIVFEDHKDLNRFTGGKFTFAANLSAVILKTGAAESAKYTDGTAVFVNPIGGAMAEASVGAQQFTYTSR